MASNGNPRRWILRPIYYGETFDKYLAEAQEPLHIAVIEHIKALDEWDLILQVEG